MLRFLGQDIPGLHGAPMPDPPRPVEVLTHYPGLNGDTEIRLGKGGRMIRYELLYFDRSFTTAQTLVAGLELFDRNVNKHGLLEEFGNVPRVFKAVTFKGAVLLRGAKRDVAGTLIRGSNVWHVPVLLTFYQLTSEVV